MGSLKWDETDFIEVTEAIPSVEEYEIRHQYDFERGMLSVHLDVRQLESFVVIQIKDKSSNKTIVDVSFYCRSGATVASDVIKFSDCILVDGRFSYIDKPEVLHKEKTPYGNEVLLSISSDSVGVSIK